MAGKQSTSDDAAPIMTQQKDTDAICPSSSDESDDESICSEGFFPAKDDPSIYTVEELREEFKRRDELMEQLITKDIDPIYVSVMRENEQAVREQMAQLVVQSKKKESTSLKDSRPLMRDTNTSACNDKRLKKIGVLEKLHRIIAFDLQNVLPGVAVLVLNCIAYAGFTQMVTSFVTLVSSTYTISAHVVSVIMILVSVVILRITGGMFDWIDEASLARSKFHMNNRLQLGKWDAVIMRWFLEKETLTTYLNVLAFFITATAVYTFQEQTLAWAFDIRQDLFEALPSVKQGHMTVVGRRLAVGLSSETIQRALGDGESVCIEGTEGLKEAEGSTLTLEDDAFLSSNMASECYTDLMGSETAILCSESVLFWYYTLSTILALLTLKAMGHKFWSV